MCRVRDQLTLYLGIKNGENVSPPWNELNCEYLEPLYEKTIIDSIPGIDDRHGGPIYKPDEFMNRVSTWLRSFNFASKSRF